MTNAPANDKEATAHARCTMCGMRDFAIWTKAGRCAACYFTVPICDVIITMFYLGWGLIIVSAFIK